MLSNARAGGDRLEVAGWIHQPRHDDIAEEPFRNRVEADLVEERAENEFRAEGPDGKRSGACG